MIEAERRAYADRSEHLGDPDFWKVPQSILLSEAYTKNRMSDYDRDKAGISTNIKPGNVQESDQTTHISIIDKEGNMVAVTTTLNNSYGSKTVVGGAGIENYVSAKNYEQPFFHAFKPKKKYFGLESFN